MRTSSTLSKNNDSYLILLRKCAFLRATSAINKRAYSSLTTSLSSRIRVGKSMCYESYISKKTDYIMPNDTYSLSSIGKEAV